MRRVGRVTRFPLRMFGGRLVFGGRIQGVPQDRVFVAPVIATFVDAQLADGLERLQGCGVAVSPYPAQALMSATVILRGLYRSWSLILTANTFPTQRSRPRDRDPFQNRVTF